jgi:hypothetical protein
MSDEMLETAEDSARLDSSNFLHSCTRCKKKRLLLLVMIATVLVSGKDFVVEFNYRLCGLHGVKAS